MKGQKDGTRNGDYPTSFWMRGEVVKDECIILFTKPTGGIPHRVRLVRRSHTDSAWRSGQWRTVGE
jgi:hypothetical protein